MLDNSYKIKTLLITFDNVHMNIIDHECSLDILEKRYEMREKEHMNTLAGLKCFKMRQTFLKNASIDLKRLQAKLKQAKTKLYGFKQRLTKVLENARRMMQEHAGDNPVVYKLVYEPLHCSKREIALYARSFDDIRVFANTIVKRYSERIVWCKQKSIVETHRTGLWLYAANLDKSDLKNALLIPVVDDTTP